MAVLLATEFAAHGDWGPGAWWPIFPLLWLAVFGVLIFALFRSRGRAHWHRGHSAEDVLAERYARGEITAEEYRERSGVLKGRTS